MSCNLVDAAVGSITLLFQDSRGGLQVSSPDGRFVDATPIPGTVVINAGDLLSRWSNDTIKSTVHRVVEPPATMELLNGETYPARYSAAYFCNPNGDTFIDALPGTWEKAGAKKLQRSYCSAVADEALDPRPYPTFTGDGSISKNSLLRRDLVRYKGNMLTIDTS